MFFAFSYFCAWVFFAIASHFVAEHKGWEHPNDELSAGDTGIDWVFFSLFFGPWAFFVLCALPPRWSIPNEQILKIRNRRNKNSLFSLGVTDQIKELLADALRLLVMVIFPLLQISIVLKFGFDWFGLSWELLGQHIDGWLTRQSAKLP
jgi:hypothetical protein